MIGITMGDANGVGPEILLKAYIDNHINDDFIVIGDYSVINALREHLNYDVSLNVTNSIKELRSGYLNIIDAQILKAKDICIGMPTKKAGLASARYVEIATQMALDNEIDAIVTLPINKEAVRLSLPDFSGHTELIAGICRQTNYTMMLASDELIVTHVSTHVSLRQAIESVTQERVYDVIKLTDRALKRLYKNYTIAVAGLNPHAGEGGAFGQEEILNIAPAVERSKADGISVIGPIPPDTVFYKARNNQYQAVVCMYHDQGHIPMKLLDFEKGVNVTLGLKVIRTSVDHGTAYDIAWKGTASITSFVEAIKYAQLLIENSDGHQNDKNEV